MRLILALCVISSVMLMVSCGGGADASTMTGFITDQKCANNGKAGDDHADCAAKCIEGGEAAVLVDTDGSIHPIANQDKVAGFEGKRVEITGSTADGKITIEAISAASTS